MDRKEKKQRSFAESEIRHAFRSHDKNARNANFGHVMRGHQSLEKYIMLGITAGVRKKGKPSKRWMDDVKSVTGLKRVGERREKVELNSEQHNQREGN